MGSKDADRAGSCDGLKDGDGVASQRVPTDGPAHVWEYAIEVYTGDKMFAATSATASLILFGADGQHSDEIPIPKKAASPHPKHETFRSKTKPVAVRRDGLVYWNSVVAIESMSFLNRF